MKTVDELYDEYFLDYFADGSVEVYIDDIKSVLDEEKEEYTFEIIDEIRERLLKDKHNYDYERYQDIRPELMSELSNIIDEYDLDNKYIVQILIDLLNEYHII
jgi:hypothetical protein